MCKHGHINMHIHTPDTYKHMPHTYIVPPTTVPKMNDSYKRCVKTRIHTISNNGKGFHSPANVTKFKPFNFDLEKNNVNYGEKDQKHRFIPKGH